MTKPNRRRFRILFALLPIGGLVLMFLPSRPLRSDNFVFYLPNASHVVPVQTIGPVNYLPLLQVLNLAGKVKGMTVAQESLKVWFEDTQIEVHDNDKRVRVKKAKLNLSDPVKLDKGQWMVPVSFLQAVLPHLIQGPIVYHAGSRRVFIGDVKPGTMQVRVEPVTNGARVTVQFSDKVSIRTASSNGKWVIFLGGQPVQALEQELNFQDPYVSSVHFDDQDGVPKLIVTPKTEGLNFYPKLDEAGKTLTADMVKPPPVIAQLPPPAPPPAATAAIPAATPPPAAASSSAEATVAQRESSLPAVVLDAGHGAEDTGASGGSGVLEKDLVAQVVARIRSALLASKKYRIVLTRLGDVNPTLDQRDSTANTAHPLVFFTFHAGNLGVHNPRLVVYTYRPSSVSSAPSNEQPSGLFAPWATIQLAHLAQSRQLAQTVHDEFTKITGLAVDPSAVAPVRVLRSVNAPAVAIEIGSLAPDVDASSITSPAFQGEIADAIVRAIDAFTGGGLKP